MSSGERRSGETVDLFVDFGVIEPDRVAARSRRRAALRRLLVTGGLASAVIGAGVALGSPGR